MTPGILGIAAGVWAVVEFTNKFWEVKRVEDKQGFEWVQVSISPVMFQFTDGDAVKAQVSQNALYWRWEVNNADFGESRKYGVCDGLEAAKKAAEEAL